MPTIDGLTRSIVWVRSAARAGKIPAASAIATPAKAPGTTELIGSHFTRLPLNFRAGTTSCIPYRNGNHERSRSRRPRIRGLAAGRGVRQEAQDGGLRPVEAQARVLSPLR